jgi:hypothetical protein
VSAVTTVAGHWYPQLLRIVDKNTRFRADAACTIVYSSMVAKVQFHADGSFKKAA